MLKKNLLLIVIFAGFGLALAVPGPGRWLQARGVVAPLVLLIFLCQGASIDGREFRRPLAYVKALGLGAAIAAGLAPLLGFAAVTLLGWQDDLRVGFLLACVMAPTLVSGTVMSVQAGGSRETALVLTVFLNLLAVLTVPLHLGWTLGTTGGFDPWALLRKLLLLILLPALVGQAWRWRWPDRAAAWKPALSLLPTLALGALAYLSVSSQAERVRDLAPLAALGLLLPALAVHYVLFAVAWCTAPWLGLAESSRRSLCVVSSQKTLPVALAIWATSFAEDYPRALLAPILFHCGQILGDSLIVSRWARRPPQDAPQPACEPAPGPTA